MECAICTLPIHPIGLTYTICSHKFHVNCLNAWKQTLGRQNMDETCPLCRQVIDDRRERVIYWPNSDLVKIYQNKDIEIRKNRDGTLKYRLVINSDNDVVDGYFYVKNRQIHYSIIENVDKFRLDDSEELG